MFGVKIVGASFPPCIDARGQTVVGTAVVVKLTRVLMLAPVVATVSAVQRFRNPATEGGSRNPLVPLFVLGFVACAALRTTGVVPDVALGWITHLQVAALGAAMFGMGASVRFTSLVRRSGPVMVAATAGTLFVALVSLGGLLLVTS